MRMVPNKWTKFMVLNRSSDVAVHIPNMKKYSADNLKSMLSSHSFVVIKPMIGTGGLGVVKVERLGNGSYRYHHAKTNRVVGTFDELDRSLNRIRNGRAYMIQQGVHLMRIQGRSVDYRVKMIKEKNSWKITAVVARIARPGLFVTNLCRGGRMESARSALSRGFPKKSAHLKKQTMRGVARTCTKMLENEYPGIAALGYDFGVDRSGRVWILEVNTRPH